MIGRISRFMYNNTPERIPFPVCDYYGIFAKSRIVMSFYWNVINEAALSLNGEYPNKILDVGTGPGLLPIEIARAIPHVHVTGLDLSNRMIKIARKNAEKTEVSESVSFIAGDANRMKFEDLSFDLVVSTASFHHWKKPLRVINEIHRVLKKGRSALIYDMRIDATEKDVLKLLNQNGYSKLESLVYYKFWINQRNLINNSKITLDEVINILKDRDNRFEHYHVESNWQSFPVLRIKLFKK